MILLSMMTSSASRSAATQWFLQKSHDRWVLDRSCASRCTSANPSNDFSAGYVDKDADAEQRGRSVSQASSSAQVDGENFSDITWNSDDATEIERGSIKVHFECSSRFSPLLSNLEAAAQLMVSGQESCASTSTPAVQFCRHFSRQRAGGAHLTRKLGQLEIGASRSTGAS